jgi:hypothetical protein
MVDHNWKSQPPKYRRSWAIPSAYLIFMFCLTVSVAVEMFR